MSTGTVEQLIDDLLSVNTFSREMDIMDDFFKTQFLESIRTQIGTKKNIEVSDFNILETLERRYSYLENIFDDDNVILDKIVKTKNDIYHMILKEISEQFGFSYNLTYEQSLTENLYRIVESVFFFFVENYNNNLQDLFVEYILSSRKDLSKNRDISLKNRDIEIAMFKKAIADPDSKKLAISIITNIEDVVSDVILMLKNKPIDIIETLYNFDSDEVSMNTIGTLCLQQPDTDDIPTILLNDDFAERYLNIMDDDKFRKRFVDSLKMRLTDVFLMSR